MSEHTPGPWAYSVLRGTSIPAGLYTIDEDGEVDADIAEFAEWSPEYLDEQVANARLIAAAPTMLDALQQVVHAFGDAFADDAEMEMTCDLAGVEAITAARAAITAALTPSAGDDNA